MISVQILEDDDIILETDFCRPLLRVADFSPKVYDYYYWSDLSMYSQSPLDHLKWAHVYNVLGPFWYGKKLKEFSQKDKQKLEFVRGNIPKEHILDTKNLNERKL